jgi:hypothetical protein
MVKYCNECWKHPPFSWFKTGANITLFIDTLRSIRAFASCYWLSAPPACGDHIYTLWFSTFPTGKNLATTNQRTLEPKYFINGIISHKFSQCSRCSVGCTSCAVLLKPIVWSEMSSSVMNGYIKSLCAFPSVGFEEKSKHSAKWNSKTYPMFGEYKGVEWKTRGLFYSISCCCGSIQPLKCNLVFIAEENTKQNVTSSDIYREAKREKIILSL